MKVTLGTKLAAALVLLALVALPAATWAADSGADVFASKCAACHGKQGDADSAMAKKFGLKPMSSAEVQGKSDADLTNIITKGKDKMPAYEGKLSADQIKALVTYIRSLKK